MAFLKKFKYLIIFLLAIGGIVAYAFLKPEKQPRIDTIVAERGDIVQEVSVVGGVKSAKNVDLAFETGGKVEKVYVAVGDLVEVGQKLAELNSSDLKADVKQAFAQVSGALATLDQYKAALAVEQAKLNEMNSGTRSEEIKIAQTKVNDAKSVLDNAKINLQDEQDEADIELNNLYDGVVNILNEAYSKADNAVNTQLDALFTGSANIDFSFEPNNSQLEISALLARRDSIIALADLRSEIDVAHQSNEDYDNALVVGKNSISIVRNFLNLVGDVLEGDTNLTASTLNTYKTNLNTARTNVNTAISNISSQQQLISSQKITNQDSINTAQSSVDNAEFSLQTVQEELDLKLAGYTDEQIEAQKAKVLQAQANISSQEAVIQQKQASVSSAQAKLNKTIVLAPINGIITKQNAKEGEIVTAQTTVISIISEFEFEIEANIPEVDISKVKIGDVASVTLDAYGDDQIFEAIVVFIDPAEKTIEGVATYKTTLQFLNNAQLVKPGMTADLEILTESRESIIAIPQRALIRKNGNQIVQILDNGEVKDIVVTTGLRGSDGQIEIVEGIKEGDYVITFME